MAKGKKNGRKPSPIEKLVFATAILNLIKAIVDLTKEMF